MKKSQCSPAHRILIIDQNADRCRRWCEILAHHTYATQEVDQARTGADGNEPPSPLRFLVESSSSFAMAVRLVTAAVDRRQPYELAVISMPDAPPADCLVAIRQLWAADMQIQTILCVRDSDGTLDEITAGLGLTDRLLVLCEPLHDLAFRQAARTLIEKWRIAEQLNATRELQLEQMRDTARLMEIIRGCEMELSSSRDDLQLQSARLSEQLKTRVDEILGTRDVMVFALERLAESRDAETGEHLERMRAYSQILAEELATTGPYTEEIDDSFLRDFALSTPLHDIGKVGVPDCILQKPNRLNFDEFEVIKRHTLIGAEALRAAARQSVYGEFLLMAADIAHWHHEWFDGTGYPDGLVGLEIPLPARIVAVADVFDAMTSRRVYKGEQAADEVRLAIVNASGKQFDPHVVAALERRFSDFLRVKEENLSFRQLKDYFTGAKQLLAC